MVRFIATVLIFAALGPLIGGFVLALATKADFERGFIILSYIVGALPALVAGLVVGMVQMRRGSAGAVVVSAVGLAVGVGIALFMAGIRAASGFEWYLALLLVASMLATFVCWGVVKAIYRQPSPAAGAAP
jgi:hypothetical protein